MTREPGATYERDFVFARQSKTPGYYEAWKPLNSLVPNWLFNLIASLFGG
jgi:hypothetical protein